MSYILDALRKAERDRQVARIPTLATAHGGADLFRRSPWLWLAVAAGALALGGVVLYTWLAPPGRPDPAPVAQIAAPAPAAGAPPAADLATASPQALDRTEPVPALERVPGDRGASAPHTAPVAPATSSAPAPADVPKGPSRVSPAAPSPPVQAQAPPVSGARPAPSPRAQVQAPPVSVPPASGQRVQAQAPPAPSAPAPTAPPPTSQAPPAPVPAAPRAPSSQVPSSQAPTQPAPLPQARRCARPRGFESPGRSRRIGFPSRVPSRRGPDGSAGQSSPSTGDRSRHRRRRSPGGRAGPSAHEPRRARVLGGCRGAARLHQREKVRRGADRGRRHRPRADHSGWRGPAAAGAADRAATEAQSVRTAPGVALTRSPSLWDSG